MRLEEAECLTGEARGAGGGTLGRHRKLLEVCREEHARPSSGSAREGGHCPLQDAPPTGPPLGERQHSQVTSRSHFCLPSLPQASEETCCLLQRQEGKRRTNSH